MNAYFWVFIGEGNIAYLPYDIDAIANDRFICLHSHWGIIFHE